MSRNPLLPLIRRIDFLEVTTWDVKHRELRPGVRVAQIPGDRVLFVFLSEPEKIPPKVS